MPSPIFVVGSGRCGSTLLRLMLDGHSALHCGPEDHLAIRHLHEWCRWTPSPAVFVRELFRYRTAAERLVHTWGIEDLEDEVREAVERAAPDFASWVDAVERLVMARAAPAKRRWCVKTPDYVRHLPLLRRFFPALRVIHLVRDGRDVVRSFLTSPLRGQIDPPDFAAGAAFWSDRNRAGDRFGAAHPECYLRVRYEDLVRDPERELARVCDFVGERWEPEMLRFDERNRGLRLIPRAERAWHARTAEPLDETSVGGWRRALGDDALRDFEAVAGSHLRAYGYETRFLERGGLRGREILRARRRAAEARARELRRRIAWDAYALRRDLGRVVRGRW